MQKCETLPVYWRFCSGWVLGRGRKRKLAALSHIFFVCGVRVGLFVLFIFVWHYFTSFVLCFCQSYSTPSPIVDGTRAFEVGDTVLCDLAYRVAGNPWRQALEQ